MNGTDINSDLEFEQHIAELSDRGLIEFVARQQRDMSKVCPAHDRRLKKVESRTKKELGVSGGLGALITAVILGVIEYFRRG